MYRDELMTVRYGPLRHAKLPSVRRTQSLDRYPPAQQADIARYVEQVGQPILTEAEDRLWRTRARRVEEEFDLLSGEGKRLLALGRWHALGSTAAVEELRTSRDPS